jgi:hypothetical protein
VAAAAAAPSAIRSFFAATASLQQRVDVGMETLLWRPDGFGPVAACSEVVLDEAVLAEQDFFVRLGVGLHEQRDEFLRAGAANDAIRVETVTAGDGRPQAECAAVRITVCRTHRFVSRSQGRGARPKVDFRLAEVVRRRCVAQEGTRWAAGDVSADDPWLPPLLGTVVALGARFRYANVWSVVA